MVMDIIIIVIMNITQINKKTLVPIWWVALIAILIMMFGVMPFVARIITAHDDEILSDILKGKKITQKDFADFINGREYAVSIFSYSSFYDDLAMVAVDMSSKNKKHQKAYLEKAKDLEIKALSISPSNPYGWLRLAYIYEAMGSDEKAAKAWQKSYLSAPYEPRLLLSRLEMARKLEQYLGLDSKELILKLIRQSWRYNPWHLTRAARDGNFLSLAKTALKDNQKDLKRFDKILKEQL